MVTVSGVMIIFSMKERSWLLTSWGGAVAM